MQKLRTGCGPDGKREPHAAFWLRLRTEMHKHAGLRFAKYRFNPKRKIEPQMDADLRR